MVSTQKKSQATSPAAGERRNVVHDVVLRPRAGSIRHFLRFDQMVEAAMVMPTAVRSAPTNNRGHLAHNGRPTAVR
jgi:hypothetical protein